jgi:acyl carrier protein
MPTMTCDDISERVQSVVAESLKLERGEVRPESAFKADLDTDSLDVIEVALAIEKEFGIHVPDEVLPTIKTVQDAIDYVKSRVV